ncbi:MAG: hypothetical protein AAGF66_09160 [Cyanobacteria bacterium P01_H01_bin.119]
MSDRLSCRHRSYSFIQIRRCIAQTSTPSTLRSVCDPEVIIDGDRLTRSLNRLESLSGE